MLQTVACRRSCRRPCRPPFQRTAGTGTAASPGATAARGDDGAGQPVLHTRPRRRVDGQFRWLRTAPGPLGAPLRGWWRGAPDHRCVWWRCAVAPARSSTLHVTADGRSPALLRPAPAEARSPRVPRAAGTTRTAALTTAEASIVVCRPPPGATASRLPAAPRRDRRIPTRRARRDRCAEPPSALNAVPRSAGQPSGLRSAMPDPIAASECPTRLPPSGCCDRHLKPPSTRPRPASGNAPTGSFFHTPEFEFVRRR